MHNGLLVTPQLKGMGREKTSPDNKVCLSFEKEGGNPWTVAVVQGRVFGECFCKNM